MRGWVRELQVTAAAVLAMFIIEKISPFVATILVERTSAELLAADPFGTLRRIVVLKTAIMLITVFFGYQGPVLIEWGSNQRIQANRPRETIQEGILGLLTGLFNGYVIIGALWWYVHIHSYPFTWIVSPELFPESASAMLIAYLPLKFLASPWMDILVVVFFLLVIIVLI